MLKLSPAIRYGKSRSLDWSGSRLVNCYAELGGADKREPLAVLLIPGTELFTTLAGGPVRGMHRMGGTLYAVGGTTLYEVGGSALGTVGGTGPVRMADNGAELAIVGGNTGYVYSGGAVTTPLSYDVSDVAYIDGYFLWTVAESDQFFISALDDGLTYDAGDIAVVEGSPDELVGVAVNGLDVLFFGADSTEIYYDSGDPDFPFNRQGNAFIERGCFDRDSIQKLDNTVYFVGEDRIAYLLDGYRPQRISDHDVEYHLKSAPFARAFTYALEGHKFYCLQLNSITLCYDAATGLWHQRQSYGQDTWRIGGAIPAGGDVYFSDGASGDIYSASNDVYDENGDPILMDIYLPTIEAGRERLCMYQFEFLCEMGLGNSDVASPVAMLRYSDDGGHSWSNEMQRSLGAIGEYGNRAVWGPLGEFRQRQMWLRISDAVKRVGLAFYAELG